MSHRIRAIATGVLVAAATLSVPVTAGADPLPTDVPTITMTVRNDTDAPMVLSGVVNQFGSWVDEASTVVSARTTETISAASTDRRGFGVQVSYTMPGDARVVLMTSDYGTGPANTDGTRIDGGNQHGYAVASTVDTGFPYMTATFTVTRR
ncbi:hypothetical protein [Rhodococcus yananensis]|uniref:hypothetical protein n=1 Tax=Rhodococcus yananensis TaxID=2879464 RepID=UPI003EBF0E4F